MKIKKELVIRGWQKNQKAKKPKKKKPKKPKNQKKEKTLLVTKRKPQKPKPRARLPTVVSIFVLGIIPHPIVRGRKLGRKNAQRRALFCL